LLTSCYNYPSSTSLGSRTCSNYSLVLGSDKISTSSFESKITITCGVGASVEVMVILRKLRVVFNSFSNSLFFCSYSKIIVFSAMGAREASGFT
jgi:hypothetical protein